MDVARSTPQGAYYHADVIYLLPDKQSLYSNGQHTLALYIMCALPVGLESLLNVLLQS